MRFIDISTIEIKAKRIVWTTQLKNKYTHLNHLIFIDNGNEYMDWNKVEEFHLQNLEALSDEDKKVYIKKHKDWNILIPIMIEEYGNKCWYSEGHLDNPVIDHFRPKNKAINYCLDQNDSKHKFILKQNGYWKLAYKLKNFRLSSHTSNMRFTDLNSKNGDMGGKSIYFPLKCEADGTFIVADNYNEVIAEKALLLDPIKQTDTGVISYDKNGEPYIFSITETQRIKANISINLYNLQNTINFKNKRQELWFYLEDMIKQTSEYINNINFTDEEKQIKIDNCFSIIRKSIDKKEPFSSVANTCYKTLQIFPEYHFLNQFNP
ncbi:hypothetical protein C3B48_02130 [Flavobacterium columnare]|uniref:hypothetical protein n=1 Tax=Flavobacterium columnare TaxID=996 RepID=UPI0018968335|nr:hypothetical protein [Flavobacterium columnare]MBF6654473.1 hypothetical protein [Flavobacterium columnare]